MGINVASNVFQALAAGGPGREPQPPGAARRPVAMRAPAGTAFHWTTSQLDLSLCLTAKLPNVSYERCSRQAEK